jgi:hypothetical protein
LRASDSVAGDLVVEAEAASSAFVIDDGAGGGGGGAPSRSMEVCSVGRRVGDVRGDVDGGVVDGTGEDALSESTAPLDATPPCLPSARTG